MTTRLTFSNVSLDFPLLGANAKSLRSRLIPGRSGGSFENHWRQHSVKALDTVNLNLGPGDRLGVLGKNGAGKTSLLRLASGIYQPTQGEVDIKGSVGSLIDIRLGFNPEASGRENIFLRAALLEIKQSRVQALFEEIVSFSELEDHINMPIRTYSSGMQMRLAFAVSTVTTPDILIMDEWLSVGDDSFRTKAEERLRTLVDNSRIFILASHSRELIERTCTTAIVLDKGKLTLSGDVSSVCSAYFGA